MFSKLNLYIVALCSFLMAAPVWAQSIPDSTNLTKMQAGNFKAIESGKSMAVLTEGNMKQTFKGMRAIVDNSGAYSAYHGDLKYTIVERSGNLAIQKYTPKMTCTTWMNRAGRELCLADDRRLAGRLSIMCAIPKGAKSCTSANGSYYELTLSGLRMGESYASCWSTRSGRSSSNRCGYRQRDQRVYVWHAPVAVK